VKPVTPSVRLWSTDTGKKVIILAIEDGKVLQLGEGDLKKLLDKGFRVHIDVEKKKAEEKARLVDMEKVKADEKARLVDWYLKLSKDKVGDKKSAPPPADLEALSRQLERINAELRDLRKRLEASKK
jgi:hypothetical protein